MKMQVLKCNNLEKEIKGRVIIENISFAISSGEIVGLLGPNGAGKTTIIKSILGLIKITSGDVIINGIDIKKGYVKVIDKVGAIIETPNFYNYLSGYDNLKLAINNYRNISKKRIFEVAKLIGLENRIKDKVSTYSLGMKQRLGIARAIINNPNLLILDEPTNGLDIEGIIEIRNLIRLLATKGVAILIASHNLNEIEKLCNRIITIKNGKIISNSTIEEFKTISNKKTYIFELDRIKDIDKLIQNQFEILEKNKIRLFAEKEIIPKIVEKLMNNNYQIYSVTEEQNTCEDAFIEKVGENKID